MRIVILAILLLALLIATAAASTEAGHELRTETATQDETPAKSPSCRKCKNAGRVLCSEHKKQGCELEDNVLFCSVLHDCESCAGTGFIDCKHCDNTTAQEFLKDKAFSIPMRAKRWAKYSDLMKRPVRVAESEHFILVWEVDSMKVDKKRLKGHELLHLYIDRLEALFADYKELLGATDRDFRKKIPILVWHSALDHKEAAGEYCGQIAERGVKKLGDDPVYSVPGGVKRLFNSDEFLHRNIVHNTIHLLMSHQSPSYWVGFIENGWADAGLAHWFEDRYWGKCDNYCYEEVAINIGFKVGKWRQAVRKMVANDSAPPMAQLVGHKTAMLTSPMHAISFSYMDYLISMDPKKVNAMLGQMRAKLSSRDAIKKVYGMSLLELERDWKAWVLETYPAR
ncbi:MAG: hypothetical protein ACI835_005839 [Planctomycetota bacterium]|jgi:hypothetical protein